MELFQLNDEATLFLSPEIDDWTVIHENGISAVIDLDGEIDNGIPTLPGQMIYVYLPIYDENLPDMAKLHATARLGAHLITSGCRVLCHCLMGLNRSALMAGMILVHTGMSGEEALNTLRARRPGALYNDTFADYLITQKPHGLESVQSVATNP